MGNISLYLLKYYEREGEGFVYISIFDMLLLSWGVGSKLHWCCLNSKTILVHFP